MFIKFDRDEISTEGRFLVLNDDRLAYFNADNYPVIEVPGKWGTDEVWLFRSREEAGEWARQSWEDRIRDDPDEAATLLGAEVLIRWALGMPAGPGSSQVRSLNEWLDLWLETPEEELGEEFEVVQVAEDLVERLGFVPRVAYKRH
jgi:hypothetical protein